VNLVLAVLATLRLTRLVTTDKLGDWWIVVPAKRWANETENPASPFPDDATDPSKGWRSKLVSGIECPFCVGFWIGAGVLLSLAIARAVPPLLPVWRFATGALGLNYLTGHIGAKLD
jgi:hypothetical protein